MKAFIVQAKVDRKLAQIRAEKARQEAKRIKVVIAESVSGTKPCKGGLYIIQDGAIYFV